MSVESVPKDLRQLRACLVCDEISPVAQQLLLFKQVQLLNHGCPHLRYALSSNRSTSLSRTVVTTARLYSTSRTTGDYSGISAPKHNFEHKETLCEGTTFMTAQVPTLMA